MLVELHDTKFRPFPHQKFYHSPGGKSLISCSNWDNFNSTESYKRRAIVESTSASRSEGNFSGTSDCTASCCIESGGGNTPIIFIGSYSSSAIWTKKFSGWDGVKFYEAVPEKVANMIFVDWMVAVGRSADYIMAIEGKF